MRGVQISWNPTYRTLSGPVVRLLSNKLPFHRSIKIIKNTPGSQLGMRVSSSDTTMVTRNQKENEAVGSGSTVRARSDDDRSVM